MALYQRKEFQKKFGLSSNYVSTNAGRGKLILQGKYIDDQHPLNKAWIEAWIEKNGVPPEVGFAPPPPPPSVAKKRSKARQSNISEVPAAPKIKAAPIIIPEYDPEFDPETSSKQEMDKRKKILEYKLLQENFELQKIKKEKQLGLVIPTDLVFGVFARHFKSVTDQFYQASDNMIIELASTFGASGKQLADIRTRLVDIVNDSVEKSKDESKKEIKNLIAEYSETKGRGEKN